MNGTEEDVQTLLSTRTIRERCARVRALAESGGTHFEIRRDRIGEAARLSAEVTRANYPDLNVPFHSRWRHFQAGGVDRLSQLQDRLRTLEPMERIRARADLVIASVLLDAGAGMAWRYREGGKEYGRSEGLALASLEMFLRGAFSSDPKAKPYRVDTEGLARLSGSVLAEGFQVSQSNPLVGFEGRLGLMKSLGRVLASDTAYFGREGRPGGLIDHLASEAGGRSIRATDILTAVQRGLGAIWPGRVSVGGFNLGDVWPYPALGEGLEGLVPFHKLSQWLTYSLVDPLLDSGVGVEGFEDLTALAEYRNGGLLIDTGVLAFRDPALAAEAHEVGSPVVIEWRALTVALMEDVADMTRKLLGKSARELPLGKVLEGGTWWAGRKIAALKRPDGGSPLKVVSDGTVF